MSRGEDEALYGGAAGGAGAPCRTNGRERKESAGKQNPRLFVEKRAEEGTGCEQRLCRRREADRLAQKPQPAGGDDDPGGVHSVIRLPDMRI